MFKTLLLITILLFQINLAYADVYKWIDENGKTVYGDNPVTEKVKKIEIKKRPQIDSAYQKRYKQQQKLLDVMQEERDEKIALKKEEKAKQEKQKQLCAKMRTELKETKDASLLYKKTDDPDNPEFLSDAERKAEEDKYEDYLKKNCK